MPTVRLSFSPAAAHVRTARLVGVAVARRAGVATELFDEIRLAIGEACSRAVALHREHNIADLVEVALVDEERFTVRVTDRRISSYCRSAKCVSRNSAIGRSAFTSLRAW